MNYIIGFRKYFLNNYKKAIFKAKLTGNKDILLALQEHIWTNINLTREEKISILKELGIWRIR